LLSRSFYYMSLRSCFSVDYFSESLDLSKTISSYNFFTLPIKCVSLACSSPLIFSITPSFSFNLFSNNIFSVYACFFYLAKLSLLTFKSCLNILASRTAFVSLMLISLMDFEVDSRYLARVYSSCFWVIWRRSRIFYLALICLLS
jgi:hypothetical protein